MSAAKAVAAAVALRDLLAAARTDAQLMYGRTQMPAETDGPQISVVVSDGRLTPERLAAQSRRSYDNVRQLLVHCQSGRAGSAYEADTQALNLVETVYDVLTENPSCNTAGVRATPLQDSRAGNWDDPGDGGQPGPVRVAAFTVVVELEIRP